MLVEAELSHTRTQECAVRGSDPTQTDEAIHGEASRPYRLRDIAGQAALKLDDLRIASLPLQTRVVQANPNVRDVLAASC